MGIDASDANMNGFHEIKTKNHACVQNVRVHIGISHAEILRSEG